MGELISGCFDEHRQDKLSDNIHHGWFLVNTCYIVTAWALGNRMVGIAYFSLSWGLLSDRGNTTLGSTEKAQPGSEDSIKRHRVTAQSWGSGDERRRGTKKSVWRCKQEQICAWSKEHPISRTVSAKSCPQENKTNQKKPGKSPANNQPTTASSRGLCKVSSQKQAKPSQSHMWQHCDQGWHVGQWSCKMVETLVI